MKILVTGGCGFLGSNIGAAYLASGCEVCVIDALFRQGGEDNLKWLSTIAGPNLLSFAQIDLADANSVRAVFQQRGPFDYICHLGGQVAMTTSIKDPRRDLQTNIVGTFNVLEAFREFCPDAFLAYSSTNKVYGDLEWLQYGETQTRYTLPEYPYGLDESIPMDFASPYGCSKGAADQYVHDWSRNFGLRTTVFRHSSIYGGRQYATFDQGWVGWFCKVAIEQYGALRNRGTAESFNISGTGKQVRDVLHATDLVALYRQAFDVREKIAGEIFNIGGGFENSLSLLELFELLQDLLGEEKPLLFDRQPRRKSDQNVFVADIRKAADLIGWKPSVSAREGVAHMLKWVESTLEKRS